MSEISVHRIASIDCSSISQSMDDPFLLMGIGLQCKPFPFKFSKSNEIIKLYLLTTWLGTAGLEGLGCEVAVEVSADFFFFSLNISTEPLNVDPLSRITLAA